MTRYLDPVAFAKACAEAERVTLRYMDSLRRDAKPEDMITTGVSIYEAATRVAIETYNTEAGIWPQ